MREALLSAILDALPDFVAQVDAAGRIHYANRSIAPSGRGVALGTSWLELEAPADRDRAARALAAVIAGRPSIDLETRAEAADGGVTIHTTHLAPIVIDQRVTGAVVITRDVTAERRAQALLVHADRIGAVGVLAGSLAHQLNNPLSVVIANLQLATSRIERAGDVITIPAVALEELSDAIECADLMKQLVGDLEVWSHRDDEPVGPVDVRRVIEATVRLAWREVRDRARIVRDLGAVPPVLANPSRLGQLCWHLIVSAAEAIDAGDHDRNTIRIATSVDDAGRVVIAIRGSAPVRRGVGHAICQHLVASLDGEIDFSSEVGTEVVVTLPSAEHTVGGRGSIGA